MVENTDFITRFFCLFGVNGFVFALVNGKKYRWNPVAKIKAKSAPDLFRIQHYNEPELLLPPESIFVRSIASTKIHIP